MKKIFYLLLLSSHHLLFAQDFSPIPSTSPSEGQKKQIARKYGMFIHFGINTFVDEEWTDGSVPASTYAPTTIDAEQWIKGAKDAGMSYVILITKHHDGFCLWDSKYTSYDIGSSGNKTNVIQSLAQACKKYNIGLGLYYSLWDRKQNADIDNDTLDTDYNNYMLNQLQELLDIAKKEGVDIVEFWFDGGWLKSNKRWPIQSIYNVIKRDYPQCQVGINWSIGLPGKDDENKVLPKKQKEGYPIRYFPSDFRLGDPYMPANPDPKLFSHDGKTYYMPWESTISLTKKWFYNTKDKKYKTIHKLHKLYRKATAQDNILIINSPPNRQGKLREKDLEVLNSLKKRVSE